MLFLDISIILSGFGLFSFLDGTIAAFLCFIGAPCYLLATKRNNIKPYWIIAGLLTGIYVTLAHRYYAYGSRALMPFGLPLLPFFGWSAGLLLLKFAFDSIQSKFPTTIALAIVVFIYWSLLIGIETVAYHIIKIRNVASAQYPGLPICDCIHMPRFLQTFYLLFGPAYIAFCQMYDEIIKVTSAKKPQQQLL